MRYFVTLRSALYCVVGLLCIVFGIIYVTNSTAHIPRFLPGFDADARHARVMYEPAFLLFVVALLALRRADRISKRALGDY